MLGWLYAATPALCTALTQQYAATPAFCTALAQRHPATPAFCTEGGGASVLSAWVYLYGENRNWAEAMKHGHGELMFHNGDHYSGDWVLDKVNRPWSNGVKSSRIESHRVK